MTNTTEAKIEKLMTRNGGPNIWTQDGTNFRKSDVCPSEGWYPAINHKRVHGANYEPYAGNTEWVKRANKDLASAAQSNFEKRR